MSAKASNINDTDTKKKISCLIVEDNLVNQKILLRFLSNLGVSADLANDGLEAVDVVKQKAYDIIFMDIQMPRMDGISATKCILNECQLEKLPIVIAVTANTSSDIRKTCKEIGMKEFIPKPVSMKVLRNLLDRWG